MTRTGGAIPRSRYPTERGMIPRSSGFDPVSAGWLRGAPVPLERVLVAVEAVEAEARRFRSSPLTRSVMRSSRSSASSSACARRELARGHGVVEPLLGIGHERVGRGRRPVCPRPSRPPRACPRPRLGRAARSRRGRGSRPRRREPRSGRNARSGRSRSLRDRASRAPRGRASHPSRSAASASPLLLGQPALVDRGIDARLQRLAQRALELARLHAETSGGVVEDGATLLVRRERARRGDRTCRAEGDGNDGSSARGPRRSSVSGSCARATSEHRRLRGP